MDFSGEGVPQDRALAAEWCERAATQGEARAQGSHSVVYEADDGVPHNDERAVAWRQRAWEQDHPGALDNLGLTVTEGRGVTRDEARGFALLNRAAGRVWWKGVPRWD
ncbi:MAG: sel1 repeat family protein [Planctomycetes bacterium]|nr:sel1 repeat family protein [Planctomycetota bacterium]